MNYIKCGKKHGYKWVQTEAYLKPSRTSEMELFRENSYLLKDAIFAK